MFCMSTHTIEPGQRLTMLVGDSSTTVSVIAEAIVPAGYWICRDECGQQRVVAHTVLAPLPAVAVAGEGVVDTVPAAATAA
jgi:hypothetical protein